MKKKDSASPDAIPGKPGFEFINHYMPGATDAEKEEAYENLVGLVDVLIGVDDRLVNEDGRQPTELQVVQQAVHH